jgi:hypothetical protein
MVNALRGYEGSENKYPDLTWLVGSVVPHCAADELTAGRSDLPPGHETGYGRRAVLLVLAIVVYATA